MNDDVRPDEGVDPVTGAATPPAPNREPAFVVPGRAEAATAKLEAFTTRTGRRPNVLVILMDDVGWGDFGCYGGGVAVGAPTPNVDRLARQGLLLTSCYSEPSCTPTRASIMTGRLPMRHGLLVPPMYGMPGGLSGEVTLPQLLSEAGYVTQAVGKWHMGENEASQPQNVGFDDFYGFLSVSDMYTEWRDPYFFPEVVYSDARTDWVRNIPFNKCFVHAARNGPLEEVEEVTIPVLSLLDDKWCAYSERFIEQDGRRPRTRGSCTTAPGGRTSTTTPIPTSWAAPPPGTPTRTPSSSSTTSAAGSSLRSSAAASSSPRWWSSPPTTGRRWRRGRIPPSRRSAVPRVPPGRVACGCRRSSRGPG